MKVKDTRYLSPDAQEAIRFRVVRAVQKQMRISRASELFQVSRQSIYNWLYVVRRKGINGLIAKARGRSPEPRLKGHQAATLVRIIRDRCPDQLKFPYALWTREAVQMLIKRRYGIVLSRWSVGRYLRQWGLSPQKPIYKAYEQQPMAVRRWLKEEYPRIRVRAKREGAEIHWEDEMGIRSDHQAGRSWGIKGQTPQISRTGNRFRLNMISSLTNKGKLQFMLFREGFSVNVFLSFLERLIDKRKRMVFVITDRHPVHRSKTVTEWLDKNKKRIQLFLLPGYSPELNPDELLNQDVKTNAVGRKRAANVKELEINVRNYLRRRQRNREAVKRYFHHKDVLYAA